MTVYVDQLRAHPMGAIQPSARRWGRVWCHLTADTEDELHAFARRLGLRREWFQAHARLAHYDLLPSKRAQAVALGAVERTTRELLRARLPST